MLLAVVSPEQHAVYAFLQRQVANAHHVVDRFLESLLDRIKGSELAEDHGLLFSDLGHLRREESGRSQIEAEGLINRLFTVAPVEVNIEEVEGFSAKGRQGRGIAFVPRFPRPHAGVELRGSILGPSL